MPNIQEKIRIFKSCFSGLQNVYGTYDIKTGKVRQVKEPVTDNVICAHLTGRQSYGVYLLTGDKTASLAVDFDQDDLTVPIAFAVKAKQYGIYAYIERSKSKGYHVWIFFEEGGVLARKARIVAAKILADIGKGQTEVFPKQNVLANGISYGNFINAPLFGALVPKGRTVFVDPAEPAKVHPDQWKLLALVRRVSEHKLDAIIENGHFNEQSVTAKKERDGNSSSGIGVLSFGLPPCGRRILSEGVDSYQRVLCFRLAVHLKRNGFPSDLALAVLKAWAKKNHPANGKGIITDQEVEHQTICAFENSYRSLGCEDPAVAAYCDKACPLYSYKTGKYSA